jgi:hypothetical protein
MPIGRRDEEGQEEADNAGTSCQALLAQADRLARKLRIRRAQLIARGLQAVVNAEVALHS